MPAEAPAPPGEPTLGDTAYASLLATLLKRNPALLHWVCEKIETPEGRKQLLRLIKIELGQ